MREVRCIPDTINANAKMVGNDSADIVAGKNFVDSPSSFAWCQSANGQRPTARAWNKITRI
jgi:hypothetical protein